MARLSDDEIDRLKTEINLVRLLKGQGYELKKRGSDYVMSCPFHKDDTPSFIVSPKQNLWHCMGACQCGGSVIDWVMKSQGVSFKHAVAILKEDVGLLDEARGVKYATTRALPTLAADEADSAVLSTVVDLYHETLLATTEARTYLSSRGLDNDELIRTFKLGYANRSLGYRLPHKNRKQGAALRGQLQRIGVYRSSGHEHLAGSLVVPIIEGGQVLELYGRKVNNSLRKGTPMHLYLPGPHRGVWNLDGLKDQQEVILCESLIDAMTFWCAGYRNVTASYGTSGFTDDHLAVFKSLNIQRTLIAYDRDEAGDKAADVVAKKLAREGIETYRCLFPKGMDANEYVLKVGPAEKSLGLVIRQAAWMGKGTPSKERSLEAVEAQVVEAAKEISPDPTDESPPIAEPVPPLAAEPLPASPVPPLPKSTVEAEISDKEILIPLGERRYRIRGLEKNSSYEVMKVNVLASRGELIHVDTFDLYAMKARNVYIKQASVELEVDANVVKRDLGQVLLKLESLQDARLSEALETSEADEMDPADKEAALELLRSPDLLDRILSDFETCGLVGESTNKQVAYLAAVSRKLDKPLAVIIQSSSAAGKSSLMEAVLDLMPEEERVQYSAMTGQSLFYMGETNLKHKILAIAEEEGAEQAAYALKLLQSEGEITIASTGKDESSGDLVTKEYRVEGPVMLFLTTTAIDIDEELLNRCLVLTVNESRQQTQAIHQMQRKQQTLEGLLQAEDKKHLIQLHRNAQRLLRPLLVANPFAEKLTFLDDRTRTRRDHMKYLTLIRTVTLLHQYQREVKTVNHNGQAVDYIEVTKEDILIANQLAHDILGRTLDELPPQTRKLARSGPPAMVRTDQCRPQQYRARVRLSL